MSSLDNHRKPLAESHELTPREIQVRDLVRVGHTNLEIGALLDISFETVKRHLFSIFHKLGVRNRTELAMRFADSNAQDQARRKQLRILEAQLVHQLDAVRAELRIREEK